MVAILNRKAKETMAKKAAAPARGASKAADKDGNDGVSAMLDAHPTLKTTVAQIEKQFGEGAIMPLGADKDRPHRRHLHRQPLAGHRPGRPGDSRRPGRRNLRPGIQRQDHAGPARHRPGAAQGRHRRLHRRRARPGPQLGEEAGRGAGNAAGQPARQRRRGDAHRRDADSLQRRGRDRDRLRGRPGAARRSWRAKSAIRTSACKPG